MTFSKTLLVLAILTFGSTGGVVVQTLTAFKTGEVTTGMTKQCYYNALGNTYTRTMRSIDLCPLGIRVKLSPN